MKARVVIGLGGALIILAATFWLLRVPGQVRDRGPGH
jgi:hypothetical protein